MYNIQREKRALFEFVCAPRFLSLGLVSPHPHPVLCMQSENMGGRRKTIMCGRHKSNPQDVIHKLFTINSFSVYKMWLREGRSRPTAKVN